MNKLIIGFDDNLGLPNDFAAGINCETKPYHDLAQLITAFEQGDLAAMFIPAGTLPYLKNYTLLSQALFGSQNKIFLRSNFVTTQNVPIEKIMNFTLGRVNQYCTTSFWAPMIYLSRVLPKNTTLTFENTNSFQDMLEKTAADKVACSMVWDIIMQENPIPTKKVHELFYLDNLPSPIIVGKQDFPKDTLQKINQFKTKETISNFSGFQPANAESIKQFQLMMKNVQQFFKVVIQN